ncbi:MAG: GntR family transcriptional regulator, partial [Clostridiaceae bacterium]|nr:GntR family transcriptional regulator [Clostridiaceae bacterium]
VLKEHRAILKAMQEKDAELAGKLAEEHIVHQQETIIQRMEKK